MAIVDEDGIPVSREVAKMFLASITLLHWDLSDTQIQFAKIELEREQKAKAKKRRAGS